MTPFEDTYDGKRSADFEIVCTPFGLCSARIQCSVGEEERVQPFLVWLEENWPNAWPKARKTIVRLLSDYGRPDFFLTNKFQLKFWCNFPEESSTSWDSWGVEFRFQNVDGFWNVGFEDLTPNDDHVAF